MSAFTSAGPRSLEGVPRFWAAAAQADQVDSGWLCKVKAIAQLPAADPHKLLARAVDQAVRAHIATAVLVQIDDSVYAAVWKIQSRHPSTQTRT